MSAPLFGNYQHYYRVTEELPIDCLRNLKEGEMVIKQGSKPTTYVAIFHNKEGVPYIKIVEAVANIFRSGTSLYPTFEHFLKTYEAHVKSAQPKLLPLVMPPPSRSILYNKPLFSKDPKNQKQFLPSIGKKASSLLDSKS